MFVGENSEMRQAGPLTMTTLVFLLVKSCKILRDGNFHTVGVTPNEAKEAEGIAVMVYGYVEPVGENSKDKILYDTEENEVESVDAYMLVDRNSTEDLLLQANSHIGRGGFKRSTIVCVRSSCQKPTSAIFLALWYRTMHYVVVECADGVNYVFNPFAEIVVELEDSSWLTMRSTLLRIWKDMRGTVIKVSAFPETLSNVGRKPALGGGLDSSFLYEFSKWHNFTPEIVPGRGYKFSNLQVWTHQVEFGVNSRFLEPHDKSFTMSHVIYGDEICHVVKVRSYVRGWEVFQTLFHTQVWFCLLGAVVCINTILSWICRQRGWFEWLGLTITALFTVPQGRVIKESKERLIIGSCFAFSLIFISYVQAMLFQILRSKPPIVFPTEELFYKYVSVTRDTPFTGDYTIMRKKQYDLGRTSGLIKPYDYALKCPGYTRNYVYLMNYGSLLEPQINRFVDAAYQSGLPDAWFSMTTIQRKRFYVAKDKSFRILTFLDFEVAFFELFIGLILSFGVFLGEILNSRLIYVGNSGDLPTAASTT